MARYTASMPLLPSALPPKGEASRYGANDFLNLIALPYRPRATIFQKVLDKSTMDGYTNMRNLRAARWCSGLTCRPVTAEIVSSNLIRVASAEVAQW